MCRRALVAMIFAVTAQGCVAYSARGASGDDGDPDTASAAPAPVADEAGPAASAVATSAANGGCSLAEGMEPSRFAPAMPRVSAPDGVAVKGAEAMIELSADGGVRVLSTVVLGNTGPAKAEARVGYSFRLQGGQGERDLAGMIAFPAGSDVRRCAAASPPQMHAVYRDEAIYAVVPIEAGAEATVQCKAEFTAARAGAPMTVLGYVDAFAQNLKNFKWSYVKDGAYAAVADRIKPFHGSVDLTPADTLRVTFSSDGDNSWLRAASFEQNTSPVQALGALHLRFGPGEAPSAVAFEYDPEMPHAEELDAFRRLSAARPDDLRAAIRLADLLRFGGDAKERAAALEKALAAWDANAKAQLLTGRNDVRAAAYVALVRSLEAAGKKADARKRAAAGLEIAKSLDATADRNRLALRWLEKYLGAAAD